MTETPHLPPSGWDSDAQGHLRLGSETIERLAERFGTPFYAYDSARIARRIAELRAELPAGLALHYAIKANPHPPLLGYLAERVDGFDVASKGEMQAALTAGMPAAHTSFAGPGKRDDELAAAVQAGVLVNVESAGELARLARIADAHKRPARVALRVNPPYELKSSGMRMGGGARAFGIDAEQIPGLLRAWNGQTLHFEGLHLFAGSQCLKVDALLDTFAANLALAAQLLAHAPTPARIINLGGGFGVPYFPGEAPLDLPRLGEGLRHHWNEWQPRLNAAQGVLELGRYLVAEAGVYVTRVVDRKHSRGETFLICDGGMHHHLALSGNLGQVLRKNWPLVVANRLGQPNAETVHLHGPLCTPLDILGSKLPLPRAEPGDLIAVFQSGAYGPSASPGAFLGHPAAAEILL